MKKVLGWSLFIASGIAFCAGLTIIAKGQPAPAPLAEIVLKVTPSELDIISEGLQTQPFGKVVPLINKLRSQVIEQQQVKPPVKE